MIHAQNCAVRIAIPPQAIGNSETINGTVIDTLGFDYCLISVGVELAAGGIVQTSLLVGDTTSPTTVHKNFGSSNEKGVLIDGSSSTSPETGEQRVFLIDLRTRERYFRLKMVANAACSGVISASAFFTRLGESGYSNTEIAGTNGEVIKG